MFGDFVDFLLKIHHIISIYTRFVKKYFLLEVVGVYSVRVHGHMWGTGFFDRMHPTDVHWA